ncbi:MAG: hypothetical protein JWM12_1286, partial [Ilumatobacteraceae bacterium]|nr:hypothetical protein [Ilumatobacteraceae bacterium]
VPRGVLVPSAQSYPTEELGDA